MNQVLLRVLNRPEQALRLSPVEWDLLIRQGRRANLLSRLAVALQPTIDQVPQAPRHHLESAMLVARRQAQTTHWEVRCIQAAIAPLDVEPILLKGAAYLLSGQPASQGRLFGDVDILVPKSRIDAVEASLIQCGWSFGEDIGIYDHRYYREWMHEIPPLAHRDRGSMLDVHHTILPPTARVKVNTAALFEDTRAVPSVPGVRVLGPTTMFLHSAAHLFHEGELENGMRDLFDLDALLRDFGTTEGFWDELVERARRLGLMRPMFYALRYSSLLLGTPMPEAICTKAAPPARLTLALADFCYIRALRPAHTSCDDPFTPLARLALYVRAHWLRMPFGLLTRHLVRKAWMRLTTPREAAQPAATPAVDT